MVRHAEVFVVAAGSVGELQRKHREAASMSWTTGRIGIGWRGKQRQLTGIFFFVFLGQEKKEEEKCKMALIEEQVVRTSAVYKSVLSSSTARGREGE